VASPVRSARRGLRPVGAGLVEVRIVSGQLSQITKPFQRTSLITAMRPRRVARTTSLNYDFNWQNSFPIRSRVNSLIFKRFNCREGNVDGCQWRVVRCAATASICHGLSEIALAEGHIHV
jgi:hypothetical protein